MSGRGRWYRQARKTVSSLAAAALTARNAAEAARLAASQPAPTAAQLAASLPDNPARHAASLREWAATRAYKDETADLRETAAKLDRASADIEGAAANIDAARTRTLHGAADSHRAADTALALLNDLLDEAAHYHSPHDG